MENMANNSRRNPSSLKLRDAFFEEAHLYEFHAALKILESMRYWSKETGTSIHREEESCLIHVHPSLSRRATDIDHVKKPAFPMDLPKLAINFFGIEARQGALPDPYVAHIIRRYEMGDRAIHSFISIFNHRLATLLHRIRSKYWIGISTEDPESTLLGKTLLSLIGLGNDGLRSRLAMPDRSLLYFSGLLWQKQRSVSGLQKLMAHFFKQPFTIEQTIGRWVPVEETQQTVLGGKNARFSVLGQDAILGHKFWNQQTFFRIKLGPLSLKDMIDFLKPGLAYRQLFDLVKFYVGDQQDFQINLVLKKGEMPRIKLGRGAALGWTAWLTQKRNDADDAQVMMNSNPSFLPKFSKSTRQKSKTIQ